MSRVADWARAARDAYACPVCHVSVGARCVVLATGRPAKETHVGRWAPLCEAYGEGYVDGERGTVSRQPVSWYDLIAQHQVDTTGITELGQGEPATLCACGDWCPLSDGGHPGHIIDVMHEHDMVVARLA